MQGQYRPLWLNENSALEVLDQRYLPHEKRVRVLKSGADAIEAISDMTVRGAGVIGNVAAMGVYLLAREFGDDKKRIREEAMKLRASRPTAVNLMWAVDRMLNVIEKSDDVLADAKAEAIAICDEDVKRSEAIGKIGCNIIEKIMEEKKLEKINILTHCNAGWLAIIDSGTALAPIYEAHKRGIDMHVWVDETRPRNQGANLTSWELSDAGIDHTIIADNTGGHLMQHDMVDMVITGADRVTRCGDAANKIGTYLKALAANDNGIPFYIALPLSTFDPESCNGVEEIEIEMRSEDEIHIMRGIDKEGKAQELRITPIGSKGANYGFDVTPARLITGLITEEGIIEPNETAIREIIL
ncbi:methylthioribose-1-phosphate isomerase [Sulfurovum lithotrophicum]|uniref:Methylthioribose-1-phosphate isomerase n=1 Tax=Sulfurovum lithotrophicum TaxID=206403 RepID=A0A7U4M0Z8_9BACT|nr:S-methyl-5-thioribose-1-phosphate isomerase [Sulfurovum lithotrophicum]AKF24884.1 methylthioribose-1-phosphate isomerase [Sulfurovum lithotrophicum]